MAKKKPLKKAKPRAKQTQPKTTKKQQPQTKKEQQPTQKEEINILDPSGRTFWQAATVTFALLFLVSIFTHGFTFCDTPTGQVLTTPGTSTPAGSAVKLDFYLMSQCPYGTQVADAIAPVLKKLGNSVEFNMDFIADDNNDGTFESLHGQPEVEGNIVQLCAAKHNPDKYMDMIVCQNKDMGAIPGNWEQCAADNSLDTEKIKACFEGDEGKELLSASIKASEEVDASGSPTIFLNDKPYVGGRGENDFLRAICNAYETDKPEACSDIPEPVKLNAIVITDERCGLVCDTTQLVSQLEALFPGLTAKTIDYSEKEAKDLMKETETQYLPAVLFDETVKEAEGYKNIENYLLESGEYLSLRIGASFDPEAEICDNEIDDNKDGQTDCDDESCKTHPSCMETVCNDEIDDEGDGLVDCDDPDCERDWVCMPKQDTPSVELFVMSHCPYGTQIEKGIIPVIELLGDKIDYSIKFCTYAMHGEKELNEQTLQHCIQKDHKEKYIDYLKCFLKEEKTDECVQEAGIDKTALDLCIKSTNEQYNTIENFNNKSTWLSDRFPLFDIDKESNEKYEIRGSPGFVVNGVVAQTGRDSKSLLDAVCTGFNEKPEECSEDLSAESPSPGFGFETTGTAASADAGCGV